MDRRQFLHFASALSGSVIISTQLTACGSTPKKVTDSLDDVTFTHGIASGDPTQDSVILWTRAVPVSGNNADIRWEIASTPDFQNIVRAGDATTQKRNDYTIKIDVRDLSPGTEYFYRFIGEKTVTQVGRTRTIPSGYIEQIKFGVFSCANYPAGFFTPYMAAAEDDSIDIVLHLGDYIYEYASDGYATEHAAELGRLFDADNQGELFTLTDYRKRYAKYREDKGLLALHKNKPFIAVWDDHEIANDTYKTGAENHTPDEGDFFARRAAAVQAYYEWLPIRPPLGESSPQIYRTFEFGDLLTLYMLDTRVIGRDKQLNYANYKNAQTGEFNGRQFQQDVLSPNRTLLGQSQYEWLSKAIAQSTSRWQLLGQQVLMGKMLFPAEIFSSKKLDEVPKAISQLVNLKKNQLEGARLTPQEQARLDTKMAYNLDAWDGYPVEREKLLKLCKDNNKSLLVIAGDTHNSWCNKLTDQYGDLVGMEFATTSVSSPGMESYIKMTPDQAKQLANALPLLIDDLEYCNLHQRGYMTLTLDRGVAQADWLYVNTVRSEDYAVTNQFSKQYIGK